MSQVSLIGIVMAVVAVIAAYGIGYSAGLAGGKESGFEKGKRAGAKEGSKRGYAVGFDRGRRNQGDPEDEDEPHKAGCAGVMLVVLLTPLAWFICSAIFA